jgi:hypothetical protein
VTLEAFLRLLVSYAFNNFIELYRKKKGPCEATIFLPMIVWLDELRYLILFGIVYYSISLVWWTLPPTP